MSMIPTQLLYVWNLKIVGSQIVARTIKFPCVFVAQPCHYGHILRKISMSFSFTIMVSCSKTMNGTLDSMFCIKDLLVWADPMPFILWDMTLIEEN